MLNMEFSIEVLELLVVELSTIVCNYDAKQAESIDNRLLDEVFDLGFDYLDKWLSFNPLSEVVHGYQQKFMSPSCRGKRSYYVHTLLNKRPWHAQRGKWGSR